MRSRPWECPNADQPLMRTRFAGLSAEEAQSRIALAVSLVEHRFDTANSDVIDVLRVLEGWSIADLLRGRRQDR